ncbi:N-acetylneuraminate synthase [Serratia fonticola]|uniref:N-acetylneuraminate synthase n=1 Tax=Serratia fonticola TaxID=47917 RepID=UPI001646F9CC|nr:N-acetylneuraminate synthase [Serratia fonticola]MBC3229575.1 N-acetylneuraminate synthase [Serratia fonticola]
MKRSCIIAEAGVNHNGNEELAFKLIDAAHDAGVDIVKFQTFKAKNLVTKNAKQAVYQQVNTGKSESQLAMLSRLELSYDAHHRLIKYCNSKGISFLSTAFDSESLEFLVNDLKLKKLKIPSGEITNAPFVLQHAKTGADIIVSTGMATLSEIERVLGVIAFGYIGSQEKKPTEQAFQEAYFSAEGRKLLEDKVTILHCTTEYPAPFTEINLNVLNTLRHAFNLPIGYSDHSKGIAIPIAAVALGATVIEKHFTLDKSMEGPDHKASLNPDELKQMVISIREVESAMGNGLKGPTSSEVKNKNIARKSIVAIDKIQRGQSFTAQNIDIKRPGSGMSPYSWWTLMEKKATKDYQPGDNIDE